MDCRFFLMCKGQCPGTSIDGDWRNRTEHCDLWMELFRRLEDDMLNRGETPISARPDRKEIEMTIVNNWSIGQNVNISSAVQHLTGGGSTGDKIEYPNHGDHTDAALLKGKTNGATEPGTAHA
jgi:uncharacterized protein